MLVDEAHCGHTRTLRRNLLKARPNEAGFGFAGTPILKNELEFDGSRFFLDANT